MDKKSEEYLSQYIKLTNKIKQKIESHANRYNIRAEICAWYSGWEDFVQIGVMDVVIQEQKHGNYIMVV